MAHTDKQTWRSWEAAPDCPAALPVTRTSVSSSLSPSSVRCLSNAGDVRMTLEAVPQKSRRWCSSAPWLLWCRTATLARIICTN